MTTTAAAHPPGRAGRRRGGLLRAAEFLVPFRLPIAGILLVALTLAGVNAAEPLALKRIFDSLALARGWDALALGQGGRRLGEGILALVVLGLLREAFTATSNWLTWRTRIGIQYRLTEATVERLHRLPLTFHRAEGVGALMTRLDRSIQGLVGALSDLAFNVVPAAAYLVLSVVVMLRLEWRLALLVLAFAPLPALIARLAAPMQTRRERTLLDRWVHIYSRFNEVLSGIVTVKSFTMEEAEKRRFLDEVNSANEVVIRGVGVDAGVGAAQNLVQIAARVAALTLGGVLVLRGQMTAGTLVAFLGYVGGLFGPVLGLAGVYKTLRTAQVSVEEVYAILDAQDLLGDAPDAREMVRLRGDVRWERVRFAYPGGGPPLLDGVDLHVREGERVAIVGPSGSGKSTLVSLVQRFYDPTEGVVRVDGIDVRKLKQVALRRQIGVVFQDSLLFNESVLANIAYGRPGATRAEIEAAARAANAHDFIVRLPQGYDTVVGERGSRLSVGERQRVSIARTLLKQPAILILDEPTSALDAESEALVSEALARVSRRRTTLVIAHRLSTVVDADRIVVLREGRIVEQGRHAELVARGGHYASLVAKQTRGMFPLAA
ncbi:ABC transporter ATP-binding protein [Anaeromyxobacter sp. PSR-1]|uniref:ABC transporter ATP-binding protein n=1 Tax=Anaeromyxobacter sp. PSR-1 TaxID=1300915 RepID=UPI0005E97CA1|nr:ABC transporter ATP-binding protein [Anaeromyxobacter sp. PSR-1]GAO03860.1 lipid A export ATP-binding/permease protein MsbA [Anaeromyxobacter sp. PSR-1]